MTGAGAAWSPTHTSALAGHAPKERGRTGPKRGSGASGPRWPRGDIVAADLLYLSGLSVGPDDVDIVFIKGFGLFEYLDVDGSEREVLDELREGMPANTRGDVSVTAIDRNWVNWERGGGFNPTGSVRVPSVFGDGSGVFATGVQRRLEVVSGPGGEEQLLPLCSPAVS